MEIYHLLTGLTLIGIFLYIRKYLVQKKKDKLGRQGELKVDRKLRFWLGWGGAKVYDGVTFMTVSGGTTQIDHIVLSRKGIFCIETKNLNGELKGDVDDKNWLHWNKRGDKNIIYNPIFQNHAHIKHLARVLKVDSSQVEGFVTNVGDAKLKGNINPMFGKAAIEKGTGFILKLFFRSNGKFTKDDVNVFKELLDEKIKDVDENIDGKHKDYVRKIKGDSTLDFVLNYLYFCIFVVVLFFIYKMFYQ
ncbi:nuclease-related domain-containing protein [Acinetobacter baumannii]|nr:NERD domain-containing protein [Acinetobacter baumannii]